MSATSDANGNASITLTFSNSTNADIAQVQVQNKLQVATATLPSIVQQMGVRVTKALSFLMVVGLISADGTRDATDLSDFFASNVIDPLSRVQGVGSVQLFGSQYAMRIRIDPFKLLKYGLATNEITGGAANAEHTGVRRPARRPSRDRGAAAQRDDLRAEPPAHARAVWRHFSRARSPTAPRSICATLRASRSARRATRRRRATTASRRLRR